MSKVPSALNAFFAVVAFVLHATLVAALGLAQEPMLSYEQGSEPTSEYGDFDPERALRTQAIPKGEIFEPGRIIAVVGTEPVLVGDLVSPSKLTPELLANREFELQLRKALVSSISRKCLAQHFIQIQTAGKPKKERDDIQGKMSARTIEIFKTQVLPEQIARLKCDSELEFIQKLEEAGTSLSAQMREFTEQVWAEQALKEGTQEKQNVWLYELQEYYNQHSDEWDKPARARFRILSASFKAYPNREAAYADIASMGNQVYLGGASFEAVAKKQSKGFNASEGGVFDWTTRGALKSKVIEDAVFAIEPRALSPILEDEDGYHILEVLERQEEYRMSFPQAQAMIRKAITKNKEDQHRKDFIQKIRDSTPIWTRWPEDIPGSQDIATIL
jgi:hypothetical protein